MRRDQPPTGLNDDDRGVSEVVAFVLVFGIILSSVAILSMTGFQAMEDYQENEQLRNAERGMESLADNFNDVVRYDGIDQRYGELSLRDGRVTTSDSGTSVDVEIDGTSINETDPSLFSDFYDEETDTLDIGEFAYTTDGEKIVYEGGGLVRGDESEEWSIVRKQPHLKCDESGNAAVVSLVQISAADRSLQSSDAVGITVSVENRTSKVYDEDSVSIVVEDTSYEMAWESIFENESNDWTWNGNKGVCDSGIDRVIVTIVEVDLEY